jgi:hypothetical protein
MEKKGIQKFRRKTEKRRDESGDLSLHGRTILKLILKE